MPLFRSRHLALNSSLGHFNGDNAHSPQIPDTWNSQWLQSSFPPTATWLSLNYVKHNPSHVRWQRAAFLNFLITPFRLSYSQLSYETCSTNTNYIFHAANKNYSLKTHFDYRHLTSSSFSFIYPTSFSEGITNLARKQQQRQHTYVTTYPR